MVDEPDDADATVPIAVGSVVYDHAGEELGVVKRMSAEGFEVSIRATIESIDDEGHAEFTEPDAEGGRAAETDESLRSAEQEHNPGQEFGEGYIMWRCDECGEMGELEEGLPNECPNCGSKEVYKWRED